MSIPPRDISAVKKTALEITNDIFTIGQKYVKHQRIYLFFSKFFKPHLDKVTMSAPDEDIIEVMVLVKKKIDHVIKDMDTKEALDEASKLNDPKIQQQVERMTLKNNIFQNTDTTKFNDDEAKALLERLKHGS